MSNVIDIADTLRRFCALEKEALLVVGTASEAFPRWFQNNETPIYWMNRMASFRAIEDDAADYGEEINSYHYFFIGRLIVAYASADYVGEVDEAVNIYAPQVVQYLDARELLQSAAYPVAAENLRFCSFVDSPGYGVFPTATPGQFQHGVEFRWRCEFDQDVTQFYL